jgi:hypothetical protein
MPVEVPVEHVGPVVMGLKLRLCMASLQAPLALMAAAIYLLLARILRLARALFMRRVP